MERELRMIRTESLKMKSPIYKILGKRFGISSISSEKQTVNLKQERLDEKLIHYIYGR